MPTGVDPDERARVRLFTVPPNAEELSPKAAAPRRGYVDQLLPGRGKAKAKTRRQREEPRQGLGQYDTNSNRRRSARTSRKKHDGSRKRNTHTGKHASRSHHRDQSMQQRTHVRESTHARARPEKAAGYRASAGWKPFEDGLSGLRPQTTNEMRMEQPRNFSIR